MCNHYSTNPIRRNKTISIQRWLDRDKERGEVTNYILSIGNLVQGDKVILCCRVSNYKQDHSKNLDDQEANLLEVVRQRGAEVIGTFKHVWDGKDPVWLSKAVELGTIHGAKLLAETTDRFIRHPDYHSKNYPNAQARKEDLDFLKTFTGNAMLVTHLPPNSNPGQVRSYHIKRGRDQKIGKVPKKPKEQGKRKQRKELLMPLIMSLHKKGLSSRKIEARVIEETGIKISHMTISIWIKNL